MKLFRVINYLRWKTATTPVLFNPQTWELLHFTGWAQASRGEWLLQRPLTLPGSTKRVILGARVRFK
jgi:hypothetical protein